MKLEVSLFKFDHKSDYLPYYTKHFMKLQDEKTLLDVLNTIAKDESVSYEAKEEFLVCVNGLYTNLGLTIEQIKADFGNEITIEPISIRRAKNDLLINEDDFNEKFDLLSKFAGLNIISSYIDPEIKKAYQSYKLYFYASNTMNVEYNYIGDAILLLASDLIEKYPKDEQEILDIIANTDYSISYHTSLEGRVYNFDSAIEQKIQSLKEKLNIAKELSSQNFKINRNKTIDFGSFDQAQNISHDFHDFNIAYYGGLNPSKQTQTLLNNLKATQIALQSSKDDLAMDTFHLNADLSLKIASNIMLEAFDKSADLLVVDSDETFYLMDFNRKELERVAGREVKIPIIHKNELSKLASGTHAPAKETLTQHAVDPELI